MTSKYGWFHLTNKYPEKFSSKFWFIVVSIFFKALLTLSFSFFYIQNLNQNVNGKRASRPPKANSLPSNQKVIQRGLLLKNGPYAKGRMGLLVSTVVTLIATLNRKSKLYNIYITLLKIIPLSIHISVLCTVI